MSPPALDEPLYDFSRLGKLGQRPAFVLEFKRMFVQRVPAQLTELQQAVETADWAEAAQTAHSLKSTFGNLRMDECAGYLRQIETLAQQGIDKLQQLIFLRAVQATANVVVQEFQQDLQTA